MTPLPWIFRKTPCINVSLASFSSKVFISSLDTTPVIISVWKIGKFLSSAIFFNTSGQACPLQITIQGTSSLIKHGKISFCLSSVISAIKAISLSPKTIILLKSLCLKNPANSKPGRLISPVKITLFKDSSFPVTCW